ncbi:MAG TPA: hypothetical protein VKZ93_03030 [Arenibacter sp.]|nr:hypothetical protein [Arenibacter sp.]
MAVAVGRDLLKVQSSRSKVGPKTKLLPLDKGRWFARRSKAEGLKLAGSSFRYKLEKFAQIYVLKKQNFVALGAESLNLI